jgi:ankyrin repeat protein
LLKDGADVKSEDVDSRTPLWWAAANGHVAVIEKLLEHNGADLIYDDLNGETALSRAMLNGHSDVVSLLYETETF